MPKCSLRRRLVAQSVRVRFCFESAFVFERRANFCHLASRGSFGMSRLTWSNEGSNQNTTKVCGARESFRSFILTPFSRRQPVRHGPDQVDGARESSRPCVRREERCVDVRRDHCGARDGARAIPGPRKHASRNPGESSCTTTSVDVFDVANSSLRLVQVAMGQACPAIPGEVHPSMAQAIQSCFAFDPAQRPTFAMICGQLAA
jgi:hypothetical protein